MTNILHTARIVMSMSGMRTMRENYVMVYRKIPIISPGLIFVQKAFLLGLFLGELIFGGTSSRARRNRMFTISQVLVAMVDVIGLVNCRHSI